MENIHGISFEDWACASAHMAQGMSKEDVIAILTVEAPQWDEANQYWTNAMSNENGFELIEAYGRCFNNPNSGKFAGKNGHVRGDNARKIPTYEDFVKIQTHMSIMTSQGVDPQQFLMSEYQLPVAQFSQESSFWSEWYHLQIKNKSAEGAEALNEFHQWDTDIRAKYDAQFKEAATNIGDDIEF